MTIDLRLGDYREVLQDVHVDVSCSDPPFSEKTHAGALSSTGKRGVDEYKPWTPDDAVEYVRFWHTRTRVWMIVLTDDVLGPVFRDAMEAVGRYAFPLVPILQHQPRQMQDGPPQHGHYAVISRPKSERFTVFGDEPWPGLPGWYEVPRVVVAKGGVSEGEGIKGGKPPALYRKLLRDYCRPGFRVADACAGGGTSLVVADEFALDGFGAELSPQTHAFAAARIALPRTRDAFALQRPARAEALDLFGASS